MVRVTCVVVIFGERFEQSQEKQFLQAFVLVFHLFALSSEVLKQ